MLDVVIDARSADLGRGLVVKRLLPFSKRRMVGPFIFLDHAGPLKLSPEAARQADVRPHPHIGLSTVTYLLSGLVTHRDSLGVQQVIRPGEVNWMTAGRGISHSERFEDPAAFAGDGLQLLQSWVALPEAEEETDPAFDNYPVHALPQARDSGTWMRLCSTGCFGFLIFLNHAISISSHPSRRGAAAREWRGSYRHRQTRSRTAFLDRPGGRRHTSTPHD